MKELSASSSNDGPTPPAGFLHHPRQFQGTRLVYPVLSRRAGGVSVGVNLSPQQSCNFNCVYCQVHRPAGTRSQPEATLDLDLLRHELGMVLAMAQGGALYEHEPFKSAPPHLRRLNDIALSGDGEPTAAPRFADACAVCAEVKTALGLDRVKLVLITNASLLHEPPVQAGLAVLDAHQGEVWAKLDAGSEAYFRRINRTSVSFAQVLANIAATARVRPIVIQTLMLCLDDETMDAAELEQYAARVETIIRQGGRLKEVQLHTVARPPAEPGVTAVSRAVLTAAADFLRHRLEAPITVYA